VRKTQHDLLCLTLNRYGDERFGVHKRLLGDLDAHDA
jgi:hypothetical protein